MQNKKVLIVMSVLALAALFCNSADFGNPTPAAPTPTEDASALQTEVASQLTQAAMTSAPQGPAALTGSIVGFLSYPADALPPMRVTAFDTNTSQPYYVDTVLNQPDYEIPNLPAGTYYVVAYSLGGGGFPFGLAGAYTAAVPCGLTESCSSHKLIPVTVIAGKSTTDIRPADFNGRDYPAIPGPAPEGTAAPTPASPTSGGSIQGSLSYPSEFIPALAVVAYRVGGASGDYSYTMTKEGQGTYSIPVSSGDYYVVAYIIGGGFAGGYTRAVPCGLQVNCTDHALIPVSVAEGAVVTGIDPGDWYASEGSFPPYPIP